MDEAFVITFGRQALLTAAEVAAPILGAALIFGLLVSIFQAITQIQEMTLAIIPKMLAVIIVISILYPWLLSKLSGFMRTVFLNFPNYVGL